MFKVQKVICHYLFPNNFLGRNALTQDEVDLVIRKAKKALGKAKPAMVRLTFHDCVGRFLIFHYIRNVIGDLHLPYSIQHDASFHYLSIDLHLTWLKVCWHKDIDIDTELKEANDNADMIVCAQVAVMDVSMSTILTTKGWRASWPSWRMSTRRTTSPTSSQGSRANFFDLDNKFC